VAPPKRRAVRISSYVVPFAPFAVIPKAIDALSGEMNTFVLCCARFPVRNRSNANSLLAETIFVSDAERARGNAVRGGSGDGAVLSLHADTTSAPTTSVERNSFMGVLLERVERNNADVVRICRTLFD
jgi:hypothetical protein